MVIAVFVKLSEIVIVIVIVATGTRIGFNTLSFIRRTAAFGSSSYPKGLQGNFVLGVRRPTNPTLKHRLGICLPASRGPQDRLNLRVQRRTRPQTRMGPHVSPLQKLEGVAFSGSVAL